MIKKKYLKSSCRIEFIFDNSTEDNIETVSLVGDFNDWDETKNPFQKKKGRFHLTLKLPLEQEFQFRYLVNGTTWQNDADADYMVGNAFGSENCVVSTQPQPASVS